ncbi:MAG: zinc ribbon domain-containing protein [Caldiserica bacterium]|nr:zinc ribbon domain-containing protein [Caldisericota bacterium]
MMFCRKCGNELVEGAAFCPKCGAPVPREDARHGVENAGLTEASGPQESAAAGAQQATPGTGALPRVAPSRVKVSRPRLSPRALRTLLVVAACVLVLGIAGSFAYPYIGSLLFGKAAATHVQTAVEQSAALTPATTTAASLSSIQKELTTAVRLNPRSTQAREALAAFSASTGNLKSADAQVTAILKLDPANEYALLMKDLLAPESAP